MYTTHIHSAIVKHLRKKELQQSNVKRTGKSMRFDVGCSLEEFEKSIEMLVFMTISDQLESLIRYTGSLIQLKNTSSK